MREQADLVRVTVVGASGFIGSQCVKALSRNCDVRGVSAPRFRGTPTTVARLREQAQRLDWVGYGRDHLADCDVVVNAAGLATAGSDDTEALLGANAVLPLFLARAAQSAGVKRLVHISSVAVQGRRVLDESEQLVPENAYALSKALGEVLLRGVTDLVVVRYRPTSVHGPQREVTRSLLRLAESPMAVVAAPGDDPTPQIPVESVGNAIEILSDLSEEPPSVVMHPWEGQTTASFLAQLGGREPYLLSRWLSKAAVGSVMTGLPRRGGSRAYARRLEMLLLGQKQGSSWLTGRIPAPEANWVQECRRGILADRVSVGELS